MQNAQPIVDILQKQLAMEIQPFVAADYTGVVEALRVNKLDVAFLTPASYVLAKNEANVKVVLKSERKGIAFILCGDHHQSRQRHQKARGPARQNFRFRRRAINHGQHFPA